MFPERISRIESMLEQEVTSVLAHHQDTLGAATSGALLTITRVVVSKNLERAIIYYSWLNLPEGKTPTDFESVLKELQPNLVSELKKRVVLKRFPKITFHYDVAIASAGRVYEILEKLKKEK